MIKIIALLKRKPGMTREEFERRWLDEHIKISSQLPNLRGYRINIATQYQPEGTGEEPMYDGTAELWWDSFEAMDDSFKTPLGVEAGADGDAFTSIRMHIYAEEHNIVPGPGEPPIEPASVFYGKSAAKKTTAKKPAKKGAAKKGAKKPAKKGAAKKSARKLPIVR